MEQEQQETEKKPSLRSSNHVDRGDMRRGLQLMLNSLKRNLYWDAEKELGLFIAKYNLDMEKIRKKVEEALTI